MTKRNPIDVPDQWDVKAMRVTQEVLRVGEEKPERPFRLEGPTFFINTLSSK